MNSNKLSKYKRIKKRILSVFMIFCMGLSALSQGTATFAAEAGNEENRLLAAGDVMPLEDTHSGWTEWSDNALPTAKGNYYLSKDITIDTNTLAGKYDWKPEEGVTLCLHGHKITCNTFINMVSGSVTIDDCGDQGSIVFENNGNSSGYSAFQVGYNKAVHLTINGGNFERSDARRSTLGVYLGSTLTINGGTFTHSNGYAIELNIFDTTLELSGSPKISGGSGDILDATGYGAEQGQIKVTGQLIGKFSLCIANLKYQLEYLKEYPFTSSQDTSYNDLANFQVYDVDGLFANPVAIEDIEEPRYATRKNLYSGQLEVIEPYCTVTYDYQGTTTGGDDIKYYYYSENDTHYVLPDPTRTGYDFMGWYTDEDDGTQITSETPVEAGEHTFYAHWEAYIFDIIYQDEGDDVAFSGENEEDLPHIHTYGTETRLEDASKTGYTFGGWYTTSDCEGDRVATLAAGAYMKKDEKILLYAKWTPNTYSVTYEKNDGTIANEEEYTSYTYGEGLDLPTPKRTGYTFRGWYTDSGCTGDPVTRITETDTEDKTYYAKWTINIYEIIYRDQGKDDFSGTHAEGYPLSHEYGTATTLTTASKTGYTFEGWYTTRDCENGSGPVTILEADSYTEEDEEIILYAKWTGITYSVTYVENEGTIAEKDKYTNYTCGVGLILPIPTKTGHTFEGWYTSSDFNDGPAVEKISTTDTGNKTYYAKWTPDTYTVTYEKNGGTIEDEKDYTSYTYGEGLTLPEPTREGYTFDGWYTSSNPGDEDEAVTEISTTDTGDKTFYAKWTGITYTVTYLKDGGEIAGESKYESYTCGVGLTLPIPTKTGYTFGGWYEDSNFSGTKVTKITTTETGNKTYYAKWTINTYKITYRDQGDKTFSGENEKDLPSTHTYGTATPLVDASKTGYEFGGWYTTPDCDGDRVMTLAADSYTEETDKIILYAKWTAETYTVTFQYQGATGGITMTDKPVTYDSPYGELPTPVKTDYVFAGWYTEADGKGKKVESTTIVTIASVHNLYAYWTDKLYTVYFRYEGATGENTVVSKEVAVGSAYGDLPEPERTGYEFVGWYTEDGKSVTADTDVWISGDHILYARWEDRIAPVIGTLKYDYEPKSFLDWLIGKDSLVITVPVTEEGSGADEITYTITKTGESSPQVERADIQNGEAKIIVHADFKGAIKIDCVDKAGNHAASVMVGSTSSGLIVEDKAPAIRFEMKGSTLREDGCYDSAPAVEVTVVDDFIPDDTKETAISSGIASITYQIDSDEERGEIKKVAGDFTQEIVTQYRFTISPEEISSGTNTITVMVEDHAGNTNTGEEKLVVKIRGSFEVKTESGINAPNVELSMEKEELEEALLTEEERKELEKELEDGKDIKLLLTVEDADEDVEAEDQQRIIEGASYYTVGQYLDIKLVKVVTDKNNQKERMNITNTNAPIRIAITIPEVLKGGGYYAMVRLHEGEADFLEDMENPDDPDTITFETDRFSTYAMVYTEMTDEDRVAAAKERLQKIWDDLTVTNDTTKESLEKQLQDALVEEGFGDVKVTVEDDFHKDMAATDKEGKVTATVTVSKGENSEKTDFDKDIDKLEPTPGKIPESSPSATPSTPPEPTPGTSPEPTPGTLPEPTPPAAVIPPSEQEKNSIAMMAGFKVSQTGKKISMKWGKVGGADGYQVYVAYCGKGFAGKPAKTVKSASTTKVRVTKISGKKLNLKKNYKVYIAAYKKVNGKKVVMGNTLVGHIVGKNNRAYTNVKRVKVSKGRYTLQAGKTAKIKAKTVLVDKTKKQLSDAHAKELRYKSTDTSVAVVSKKGKITAKGQGTCIIYVYARNGYARKIRITVK